MRDSRLILYLPDLVAAVRVAGDGRFPVMEKFLARATRRPVADGSVVLAECFGMPPQEFPVAALEWLGLAGARNPGHWWRADPVHLLVDRDQVVMLPHHTLGVTPEEARALAASINACYADDHMALETPRPDAWHLRTPQAWHCRTWDPARVEDWAITEFMPSGAAAEPVRKLMTEIQMLLHTHPVNQAREAAGQPTINSVWIWGGGPLPDRAARAPARIIASLPLVRGLAQLAGQTSEPWPADLDAQAVKGEWLVALSAYDFGADLTRLERELMVPLWRTLLRGRVREIRFYPGGNSVYELTPLPARHFWRRARALVEQLRGADDSPAH
ncbi:MAG: hypothetical protein KGJ04_00080 [Gammaproteobacteria bacterium]|nr:hypothetical protein [Gammaproteobacteria bacterium]